MVAAVVDKFGRSAVWNRTNLQEMRGWGEHFLDIHSGVQIYDQAVRRRRSVCVYTWSQIMLKIFGNLRTQAAVSDVAPFTRASETLIFASQPGAALSQLWAWLLIASRAAARLFLESSGPAAGLTKSAF